MKKTLFISISAILIILIIFFFQSRTADKNNVINFGIIPIADAGVLYVAIEKGYLEQEGITAKIIQLGGGSLIINAMSTNDIQVGFSNTMSVILANSKGIKLLSLGGVAYNTKDSPEGAIISLKSSNINNNSDLKGKTIAINARNNLVELSLNKLFALNDISIDQVKKIEIPFPQMEAVLRSKKVDAIVVAEPFWTFAEKTGGVKTVGYYYGDVYDKIEIAAWFSNEDWLYKNPDLAKKIQNAFKKAVKFLNTENNIISVRNIIKKYTKIDSLTAQRMRLPKFQDSLSVGWMSTLVTDLKTQNYIKQNFILNKINY